jgi:hypothetical protein
MNAERPLDCCISSEHLPPVKQAGRAPGWRAWDFLFSRHHALPSPYLAQRGVLGHDRELTGAVFDLSGMPGVPT